MKPKIILTNVLLVVRFLTAKVITVILQQKFVLLVDTNVFNALDKMNIVLLFVLNALQVFIQISNLNA